MPLNNLLKQLRLRISPDATTIGSYARLPVRRGRPVTQEELAECLGVTRTWYAFLESGRDARPSFALLARIAELLELTPEERGALLSSAFPELGLREPESTNQTGWRTPHAQNDGLLASA